MAFEGLEEMEWTPPSTRRETVPAIERQQSIGGEPAGEPLFGYTARGSSEKTLESRSMWEQFMKLGKLRGGMNSIFSRTIPTYYSKQNQILSLETRVKEREHDGNPEPSTAALQTSYAHRSASSRPLRSYGVGPLPFTSTTTPGRI